MVQVENVISYGQNYLTIILNLSIILATANSILLYNKKGNIWVAISSILCILSIILIMYDFRVFFDFLLQYEPNKYNNMTIPFKNLSCVFLLQIISLILLTICIVLEYFKKGKNER